MQTTSQWGHCSITPYIYGDLGIIDRWAIYSLNGGSEKHFLPEKKNDGTIIVIISIALSYI